MKRGRLIVASALVLIIIVYIGWAFLQIHVWRLPTAEIVLPVVNSFLETNGYTLVLQGRNDVTHTRPPFFLRLWGITKEIRDRDIRLGGVVAPNQHGYTCKYRSEQGKEVTVAVDVRGDRVYHVTFIDGTNSSNFFPEFVTSLKNFGVPVGLERQPHRSQPRNTPKTRK